MSLATAWPLILLPSILLSAVAHALFPGAPKPDLPLEGLSGAIGIVLFAPIVETLIMAAILELAMRWLRPTQAIVLSALAWGVAHSLAAPSWGLVVWWPFMIFSTLYVVWKARGLSWALVMPMIAHALHNLTILAAVRLGA